MIRASILAASFALFFGATPVLADELSVVLERTRAVYGADALPTDGTVIRSRGIVHSQRLAKTGGIVREVSWPDYLRIDISYPNGQRETRLMLGEDGWRDGASAPAALVAAMRLQAARLSLPMILWWERAGLNDVGPAIREDGVAVHRAGIEIGEGLALFVEIETTTGRILRSAGVMRMDGAEMSFGASYSEFRPFGQLTWPAREEQSAMGQAIGWTEIEHLETGAPFDRSRVRP